MEKVIPSSKLTEARYSGYETRFTLNFSNGYVELDYNAIAGQFQGCLVIVLAGEILSMHRSYEMGSPYGSILKIILQSHPDLKERANQLKKEYIQSKIFKQNRLNKAVDNILSK